MAQIEFKDFSFKYPKEEKYALNNINFTAEEGELILICGPSSSGKSTLLQQIKREIAPQGQASGEIFYKKKNLMDLDDLSQAADIGMVFQEPDAQVVTDKVVNELAFAMENLAYPSNTMGRRLGELVQFFGLEDKLYEDIDNLSGGQKQLLNLASVLVLQPKLLLLDEPTSQLDPIASRDFLQMIESLNRDYSITVLISEHRLDELFPLADKILVLDQGGIKYRGRPKEVAEKIYQARDETFFSYLPDLGKLYFSLDKDKDKMPFTVREGRRWARKLDLEKKTPPQIVETRTRKTILEARTISFRYERKRDLVLNKLNISIQEEEILSILGGNGSGKSTLLKILAGGYRPQYGGVFFKDRNLRKIKEEERYKNIAYLDQNPLLYFLQDTVKEELYNRGRELKAREEEIVEFIELFQLGNILNRHPYDISGGEKQKLALALVLLAKPQVLLLDEPTKGIDPVAKNQIGDFLLGLRDQGLSIVLASHDMEFAARFSDRVGLLFDGDIRALEGPREFFTNNFFYTTSINRILRDQKSDIILYEDVIANEYI